MVTPAAFWILVALIVLFMGAVIVYWATTRRDGIEPDGRPVNIPAPTQEDFAIIAHQKINYGTWLHMSGPQQAAARDAYYNSKRF